MSKWTKDQFVEDMRNKCSREIAKIGEKIIEFSDTHASEVTWGRGDGHGTFTFRSDSDVGVLPLFHMTSNGQMNLQINFLREKELPKQVMRDLVVKIEEKVVKILSLYEDLKNERDNLAKECDRLTNTIDSKDCLIEEMEEKIKLLKITQSVSTQDIEKDKESRDKINEYVREIDRCIAMLNK